MKKLSRNSAGFSAMKGLLIVVIVALVGFVGWYVWHSTATTQQSTQSEDETKKSTQSEDETKNWTVFTSSKGWKLKVPDGWKLYTDSASTGLTAFSSLLEYKPGTRAVIEKTDFGRGGPFVFDTGNFAAGDLSAEKPDYLTEETVFKARNAEGKRYTGTLKEDMEMVGFKGDIIYWYVFIKPAKFTIFYHTQAKGAKSILTELEKSISTLEFK